MIGEKEIAVFYHRKMIEKSEVEYKKINTFILRGCVILIIIKNMVCGMFLLLNKKKNCFRNLHKG